MLEIRFHGRGGQGTVLAAKMLADAVLRSGWGECMAIPEFGVERRGAPVLAYARISKETIRVRARVYAPDAVVVLDPVLAASPAVLAGLKPGGIVIVNSEKTPSAGRRWRWLAIPAKAIARSHGLGPRTAPMVNTAMCGALVAALEVACLPSLEAAVRDAVPAKPEENVAAAREAYSLARRRLHAAA
ncbi:MAG: 2-oxoacid:acceptor oxidoreductase family protein [Elusimicrobia bacterium]|nr:2-oxoacid:acceptor oxidoreductase family protein [Elusimicrobiota bacterium]